MAFEFRDREALQVVMTTGLCPAELLVKPARVSNVSDGRVIVAPDEPVSQAVIAKLRAAGVAVHVELPDDARAVTCWAEAIRPTRVAIDVMPSHVVFVVDDVVALAAELVRLGCERFELQVGDGFGVARVVDPPTYTTMRGLDRDGVRVYAPDPPGQDAVWTELGHRHPLAAKLRADTATLLLVGADRWLSIPDRGWLPLDAVIDLAVPGEIVTLVPGPPPPRRRIELRLANGRRDAPSLWVIRDGGVATIDRLLEHLPDDVVARLTFAVSGSIVVLRARTSGRLPAPDLSLDAEAYAPLAQMADVLAPSGSIIEPPIRRDRLRTILRASSSDVTWLAPIGAGKFRVERIADDAFTPLSEWADYVVHAHAAALKPWTVSSVFEFAPFVSTELDWKADDTEPTRKRRAPAAIKKRGARAARPPVVDAPAPEPEQVRAVAVVATEASDPVVVDRDLATLEAAFVAMDSPGDDPHRLALLDRLARSYARLGRHRDAGLCFVRVVWELPAEQALTRWRARIDEAAIVDEAAPDADAVRDVAFAAAAGAVTDPHRVTRWLDDHDDVLDARTLWLSRLGLAKLAGGDPLGLARVRDRILARLAGGLPVERELPAFLRFGNRGLGMASGDHLIAALDELTA
ncbi:MAG TPA: hypothetical protein VGO00_22070, partial [Kofleriaceae bacterium]|nr:hypothetical protein [Kofleriaceae bacterium]